MIVTISFNDFMLNKECFTFFAFHLNETWLSSLGDFCVNAVILRILLDF